MDKEAQKAWRERNPDKVKGYAQKYRAENQEEINRKNRERRALNPELDRNYKREWRLRHPNERKEYQQRYYKTNQQRIRERSQLELSCLKLEVLTHYSTQPVPICPRCRIDDIDVLCIDHIKGNGNEHRRSIGGTSGTPFYQWLKTNNYPEEFQILCYNCNQKKRILNQEN